MKGSPRANLDRSAPERLQGQAARWKPANRIVLGVERFPFRPHGGDRTFEPEERQAFATRQIHEYLRWRAFALGTERTPLIRAIARPQRDVAELRLAPPIL